MDYYIAGTDVEDALLRYPKITERSVVGVPGVERREIVKANV